VVIIEILAWGWAVEQGATKRPLLSVLRIVEAGFILLIVCSKPSTIEHMF
jgi:hypothetical protein